MSTGAMLPFLSELKFHNEREWFHAHKKEYNQAVREFEAIVEGLILQFAQADPQFLQFRPKDLTFRIMRDVRYRRDKSPYNPSFRAHFSPHGKRAIPVGLYLKIQPGNRSVIGGGLHTDMFREATIMVRDFIVQHGEEWEAILQEPSFASLFTLKGSALKNVPRGYDAAHPQAAYLKFKSWYVEYPLTDEQVLSPDFPVLAMRIYTVLRPFNDFLNRALAGFVLPEYY